MNRNAVDQGMIHLKDNVYFNKLGEEIMMRINIRISTLASEMETHKSEVAAVCKKREINIEEVLKDKDINSYVGGDVTEDYLYKNSASLSRAVGSMNDAPMQLAKVVMEDLQKIIKAARFIVSTTEYVKHLRRVQTNLNGNETYKLYYQDLLQFGF